MSFTIFLTAIVVLLSGVLLSSYFRSTSENGLLLFPLRFSRWISAIIVVFATIAMIVLLVGAFIYEDFADWKLHCDYDEVIVLDGRSDDFPKDSIESAMSNGFFIVRRYDYFERNFESDGNVRHVPCTVVWLAKRRNEESSVSAAYSKLIDAEASGK